MILTNEELEELILDYSLALAVWNKQERKQDTSHNWFTPEQLSAKEAQLPTSAHSGKEMTRVLDNYLRRLTMSTTKGDFWTDIFKEMPLPLSQNAKEIVLYARVEDSAERFLRPVEYRYQPALLRGDLPVLLSYGIVGLIRMKEPKIVLDGTDYSEEDGKLRISDRNTFSISNLFNSRNFELRCPNGMYRREQHPNLPKYRVMLLDLKRAEHS